VGGPVKAPDGDINKLDSLTVTGSITQYGSTYSHWKRKASGKNSAVQGAWPD
jgi:hypothetical protein